MNVILNSHLLWDVLWQSTLFLGMGGLCSYLFRQRPSRAHRILFLSLLACLATPFLSQFVRSHNWGMLPEATPILQPVPATFTDAIGEMAPLQQDEASSPAPVSMDSPSLSTNPAIPTATLPPIKSVQTRGEISWQAGFLGLWSILTSLVLINVLIGVVQELYTLRDAHEIQDGDCDWLLKEAVRKLGLKTRPRLYSSSHIKTPMVCCWGMRPRLILPDTLLTQPPAMNLGGILCHELAHWKRRDHLTTLMSLIGLALLPWHPLMLWVKRRMSQLSEMSCDHWVLACGYPPETYAESLLKLQPHKSSITVLPAVSARKNLENRLKSILDSHSYLPHVGGKWNWVSTALTIALVSTVAFAKAPLTKPGTVAESNAASEVATTATDNAEQDTQIKNYSSVLEAGYTLRQFPKDAMPLWQSSAPTSDGRYVVGAKDNCLQLLDLTSGETRRLTNDSGGYPTENIISPNNKTVAYSWLIGGATETQAHQLRVIDLDGTHPRTLLAGDDIWRIGIDHWTPDSNFLLCDIWRTGQKEGQIALISLRDGSLKNLFQREKFSSNYIAPFHLTPDQQYIIFTEEEEKDNYDILCYSLADRSITPIISASSSDRLIGLSPDGKWMVFTSNRLGTTDLWIMPLGQIPSGNASPILVKKSIGFIECAYMNSQGGLYFYERLELSDIYIADVDWKAHTVKENPIAISASIRANNKGKGQWSPQGDEIAFEVEENLEKTFHIYSLTDQQMRSVPGVMEWEDWTWSLDGQSLYAFGTPKGGEKGVYRINPNTDYRETILTDPQLNAVGFSTCPEMKTLYNHWILNGSLLRLHAYDVETKTQKVFFENTKSDTDPNSFMFFQRSPDGKWLACLHWLKNGAGYTDYVCLISTETGAFRHLYKKDLWVTNGFPRWMPDSHSLVFCSLEIKGSKAQCELYKLDIDNVEPERIWTFDLGAIINEVQVHPSGEKILYDKIQVEVRYYGLENFLPNL